DGRPAGVLAHDAFVLGLVVEAKRLDDGADLLEGVQQLLAAGGEGGEAGRELAAILQIEQQPRHEPRYLLRSGPWGQPRRLGTGQMVNRGYAALVVQFVHPGVPRRGMWIISGCWAIRLANGTIEIIGNPSLPHKKITERFVVLRAPKRGRGRHARQ